MQPNNILIIGNYGAGNLGDDAIFAGIISDLHNIGYKGEISLLHSGFPSSKDIYSDFATDVLVPSGLRSRFKKNDTFDLIKKADLVILGGGGLFVDTESIKAPLIWYTQAMACVKLGIPYICYSQSVGPLHSFISRFLTRRVFNNAQAIHVRDNESLNLLRRLGVNKEITVSTDSALSWSANQKKSEKKDIFLLSLRKWEKKTDNSWKKIIYECEDYSKANGLTLKLIPMDLRDETELKMLRSTGLEVLSPKSVTDVVRIISESKILCSMRLHASILALGLGTPVLSISYSTKVKSFIETLGIKSGAKVLDLNELDQIKDSLSEIFGKVPSFDLETPTRKNQEFLAHELHL